MDFTAFQQEYTFIPTLKLASIICRGSQHVDVNFDEFVYLNSWIYLDTYHPSTGELNRGVVEWL